MLNLFEADRAPFTLFASPGVPLSASSGDFWGERLFCSHGLRREGAERRLGVVGSLWHRFLQEHSGPHGPPRLIALPGAQGYQATPYPKDDGFRAAFTSWSRPGAGQVQVRIVFRVVRILTSPRPINVYRGGVSHFVLQLPTGKCIQGGLAFGDKACICGVMLF